MATGLKHSSILVKGELIKLSDVFIRPVPNVILISVQSGNNLSKIEVF